MPQATITFKSGDCCTTYGVSKVEFKSNHKTSKVAVTKLLRNDIYYNPKYQ